MPLPDDYKELLKSDFADMNNIGANRWGGAITAALFISEFIADTPVRLFGNNMDLEADAMRHQIHANRTFLTGNVRGRFGGNVEL